MRLPHTLPCAFRSGKSVVIRTSTRQTIYLPVPGLIDPGELTPGELVGTNKDSYLILEKLPSEYDSRVKVTIFQCTIDFQSKLLAHQLLYSLLFQAMEVDEKPSEEYSDIGGCSAPLASAHRRVCSCTDHLVQARPSLHVRAQNRQMPSFSS